MTSLTAKEVAEEVNLTPRQIAHLAQHGVIMGEKRGGVWFFSPFVVIAISTRREKRGRPAKK